MKFVESRSVDNNRQIDIERNVIHSFQRHVDKMSSTIFYLKDKINFLENRDRTVATHLSRIQPEIDSLKNVLSSLKSHIATTERQFANSSSEQPLHSAVNHLLVKTSPLKRLKISTSMSTLN